MTNLLVVTRTLVQDWGNCMRLISGFFHLRVVFASWQATCAWDHGIEPVLVDALAHVMMKDRAASDMLSKTTATPELSEGTIPNAHCLHCGLQSGTWCSSWFRVHDSVKPKVGDNGVTTKDGGGPP